MYMYMYTVRAHVQYLSMCIRAGLFILELDGETKITDDTGKVVADENVLALQVSVSYGRLLCDTFHDPLVVEMGQT